MSDEEEAGSGVHVQEALLFRHRDEFCAAVAAIVSDRCDDEARRKAVADLAAASFSCATRDIKTRCVVAWDVQESREGVLREKDTHSPTGGETVSGRRGGARRRARGRCATAARLRGHAPRAGHIDTGTAFSKKSAAPFLFCFEREDVPARASGGEVSARVLSQRGPGE